MKRILILLAICTFCISNGQPKDWTQQHRYAKANQTILSSGIYPIVVYMGDSITDHWGKFTPDFFAENNFACRGISGQVTSQMLIRFREDVVALKPKVVFIMAGTNDLALNNYAVSDNIMLENIHSMCDIAHQNGIRVIVCSIPASSLFKWRPSVDATKRVCQANLLLKQSTKQWNVPYLDLHTLLCDWQLGLPEKWSKDGTHPNTECYQTIFNPIAKLAVEKVLRKENVDLDSKKVRKEFFELVKQNNYNDMIYPIVTYGDPILRKTSTNIDATYPELKSLIENMFLTLAESSGVGLAAPQIGKNIRLFVVDCTPWAEECPELVDYKKVFINAEIYERSEETSLFEEGCLSIPGIHESVRRPVSIRMRYLDENLVEHDEEFTGYPARVIQHEYDHLEGKVFTDHLSALRRNLIKGKILNIAKGKFHCDYKTK